MGKTKIGVGRCQICLAEAIIPRCLVWHFQNEYFFPISLQAPPCAPPVAGIEL
jgi:hypothetical protein